MPEIHWRHYAENKLAPIRRKLTAAGRIDHHQRLAGVTGWPRAIDKQFLAGAMDLAHGALKGLGKEPILDAEAGVTVGATGTLVTVGAATIFY